MPLLNPAVRPDESASGVQGEYAIAVHSPAALDAARAAEEIAIALTRTSRPDAAPAGWIERGARKSPLSTRYVTR